MIPTVMFISCLNGSAKLNCTMISSVDIAHNEVSNAKDRLIVDCGTVIKKLPF